MKRILSLLLVLVFALGFAACGKTDGEKTDTAAPAPSTDTSAKTDTAGKDNTQKPTEDLPEVGFDKSIEHKIIVTDMQLPGLVVYDLNKCSEFTLEQIQKAVVWKWNSQTSNSEYKSSITKGIDDGKFRYSPYYKKDVVIATSSSGWAGVIDYETGNILWETTLNNCPHSIEMLPNGDVVVAGSGGNTAANGSLVYYPLSRGKVYSSDTLMFNSCHGVCWDPTNECLWTLGGLALEAVMVTGYDTDSPKLKLVKGLGCDLPTGEQGGHDLSPVYGQPGKYWETGVSMHLFDSEKAELSKKFSGRSVLHYGVSKETYGIKGIAYFKDGTMVQTRAGIGENLYDLWSTRSLFVFTQTYTTGKVKTLTYDKFQIDFGNTAEFYKVHTFTKDYQ